MGNKKSISGAEALKSLSAERRAHINKKFEPEEVIVLK